MAIPAQNLCKKNENVMSKVSGVRLRSLSGFFRSSTEALIVG